MVNISLTMPYILKETVALGGTLGPLHSYDSWKNAAANWKQMVACGANILPGFRLNFTRNVTHSIHGTGTCTYIYISFTIKINQL